MQDTANLEQVSREEASLKSSNCRLSRSDCKEDLARGIPAEQVAKKVGAKLRGIMASLQDGIKKFGPPPCRFSFVVLGSLARGSAVHFPISTVSCL